MGREFELKYQADAGKIQAIREKFQSFEPIQMESVYYDTLRRDLRPRLWTLRRRQENDRSVCTLKTPLPDGSRGEWEVDCGTVEEGVFKLCKLDVPAELSALTRDGLVETCGARFIRLAKTLTLPRCTVELALDQGILTGGGRELAFAEVEVELKSGEEAAAAAFAAALAREFGLKPERKSKQQRALELER